MNAFPSGPCAASNSNLPTPVNNSKLQLHWLAALIIGIAIFAGVWLAELSWTSLVPPSDNIEQITWVGSLELGYYKHPPLPTWLFWLPARLFGASAWTSYMVGVMFTIAALLIMGQLLLEVRGPHYALIALLGAACITYYNCRLYYYNHNVVLMFFVSASAYAAWRCVRTGSRKWWAWLGLLFGLGFMSKYQMAVTVLSLIAFWLQQGGWRGARHRRLAGLAAAIAAAIFLPHAVWVVRHDFAPVHYAMSSSLGVRLDAAERVIDSLHWLIDQLLNRALPCWLLLAWAVASSPGSRQHPTNRELQANTGRRLLLAWGLIPIAFMPAVGLVFGADLQLQWGTPFLLFSVPAVMELLSGRVDWEQLRMPPLLKAFVVIQVLLLVVNFATSPKGPRSVHENHWRHFDSQQLAELLEGPAHEALGSRVCVVSGPGKIAGALALAMRDHPKVLIDGRYDISPWITRHDAEECGILELVDNVQLPGFKPVGPMFPRLFWRIVR